MLHTVSDRQHTETDQDHQNVAHCGCLNVRYKQANRSAAVRLTSLLLQCDVCHPAVFSIRTNKLSNFRSNQHNCMFIVA